MVAQLDLVATSVQDSAQRHVEAARLFAAFDHRLDAATQAMSRVRVHSPSPEEDDAVTRGR
jgi:hypothetical protein